ncbi:leucine--tRNA ligase [Patescibacteria group bacterium]|nr:leucine--tRNA ligase [Patescibacteria group bacterium]
MSYNHQEIEKKWQDKWEVEGLYKTDDNSDKPRYYCLDMFPYPSGAGLHVGHPEGYTATDIVSRYKRMKGFEVMHPMGWDAFGLPAENYAIKTGVAPEESIRKNIKTFRRQIKSLGLSYDWDREFATCDPKYYKWTQWFFLLLYKNDLAYKAKAKVNWCESCKTVLANEQVIEGKCERCQSDVIQKDLEQWFFKTTAYADRLLEGLDEIDFPEKLKSMQRNWIGRSEGATLEFSIKDTDETLEVFTTRPDTLFGATYMVLAPEHSLVDSLADKIENLDEVKSYIKTTLKKNEIERTDTTKEKTGVELKGLMATNPANGREIPIWIADYVLSGYGTGAIMAVPAHDERDYEFAKKFNLDIVEVISGGDIENEAYVGEGQIVNSGEFNDLDIEKAKVEITNHAKGELTVQYKLRDWLVSRQRYWGAPIPIIHCTSCGEVPVPEKDLPVKLPTDVDFKPTGESPLKSSEEFNKDVVCPKCGQSGEGVRREADTMDTFVCSSWYFYRYLDARNDQEFCSPDKIKKWMPVDLYVGGAEHAVGHLVYSRFFNKVLKDYTDYVDFEEPFTKLVNQGLILAEDGRKMSKSLGNVINPDEVVEEYGADTLRMYEMFMGPLEDQKPWDTKGIVGIKRFLDKVYVFVTQYTEDRKDQSFKEAHEKENDQVKIAIEKTVQKVTHDIEEMKFNTAISAMMEFINLVYKTKDEIEDPVIESEMQWIASSTVARLLIILSPFAPHLSEELWQKLGHQESVFKESWPEFDEALTVEEEVEVAVQINGKVRGKIMVKAGSAEEEVVKEAKQVENVQKHLEDKKIKKAIYVEGRLLSLVV